MGNPERIIILPNGKHVPTFRGLTHPAQWRTEMSQLLSNRPKPREQVEKMSTVWGKIKPLAQRGAVPAEIVPLTDFTIDQIRGAYYRNRPTWNMVPRDYTAEQLKERRRKAAAPGQPKRKADRQPAEQLNSNLLARKFINAELIGPDLSRWEELVSLYKKTGRSLPQSFADCLRLEVLLAAIQRQKRDDPNLLQTYNYLGGKIDPVWFTTSLTQEELFVAAPWADGRDEKGFFRLDTDGNRWRPIL